VGEWVNGKMEYSNATSCLMPLANAMGKHIVTIEGVNVDGLNVAQQAFADEGATQCGFCTPGFIVSLTGYCLTEGEKSHAGAIDAMNGNICRCTGYKSIQRAAGRVSQLLEKRKEEDAVSYAVSNKMIPSYFKGIPQRIKKIQESIAEKEIGYAGKTRMGGGTDLFVQRHDTIASEDIEFLYNRKEFKFIKAEGDRCVFGSAVTASDIANADIFKEAFPYLDKYIKLISSVPIRNMGTIAGNFVNASPIGDFTIFFLALNPTIVLSNGSTTREVSLRKLYKGYKLLDKMQDEMVVKISVALPKPGELFNFEKVSKRTNLDIASVNSAIHLKMNKDIIAEAGLSAGGVGPIPMYLSQSSNFLTGKKVSPQLLKELIEVAQQEISPISDARGTDVYKRLLLAQLLKSHFITLFPEMSVQAILEA